MDRPYLQRTSAVTAGAVVAGGVLAALGSRLSGYPFQVFNLEGLAVLASGLALAAGGVVMLILRDDRARGLAAAACLVLALIPLGLTVHLWLLGRGTTLPLSGILALVGAALGAAAAGAMVGARVRVSERLEPPLLVAIVGGAVAAIGSFLPWIGSGSRSISGFSLLPGTGKLTLALALATAAGLGALPVVRSERGRTAILMAAASAAAVTGVLAMHAGMLIERDVGLGVYLVVAGGVVGFAAIVASLLALLGLPKPSPAGWVTGLFVGFGVLGLVLSFALHDRLEDVGGAFSLRLGATFLLLAGAGLAAHQTWAWLLGFPVALAGIANGGLVVATQGTRGFGLLAILVYANALNALWRSRGRSPYTPVQPQTIQPPSAPPDQPAPAPGPPPPAATAPVPEPSPTPVPEPPAVAPATPSSPELPEDRTWQSDPALAEVLEPLDRGEYAVAAAAAQRLVGRFPDLDLIYLWWGRALREQGDAAGAREVIRAGIDRSRRKHVLADVLRGLPAPQAPATAAAPAVTVKGPRAPGGDQRRRIAAIAIAGILLVGAGIALGATVFGDDEPASPGGVARPGSPDEPLAGLTADPVEVVSCLLAQGVEVEQQTSPVSGGEVLTLTTPQGMSAVVVVYSTFQAAEAAKVKLGEVRPEEGLVILSGNVLILYTPPPTAEDRRAIEGCALPA